MPRARTLAVIVLLLSYGAVGARQPAVRAAAPLPAPAATLAQALGLSTTDRSRILLDIIRTSYDTPEARDAEQTRARGALQTLLTTSERRGETVPLPLDPSIWRDTLLQRDVPDAQLVSAILSDRRTALMYYGLAALDDETLAWLGPDRDLLAYLLRHSGSFASFGRSLRVKAGRVVVPGGEEAEPIWEAVIGASPTRPAAFARRLFSQWEGRLAFFYDTMAHLDQKAMRFALATALPRANRLDRVRTLANVFEQTTADMHPEMRPFTRQLFDPALTLSLIKLDEEGRFVGPSERWFWDAVFRHEGEVEPRFLPYSALEGPRSLDASPVDAAWIVSRIHRGGFGSGRRRLETVLFAQRNYSSLPADPGDTINALRGLAAFPALMLTLERSRMTAAPLVSAAALRAEALSQISDDEARRSAMLQFQAAVSIVTAAVRVSSLPPAKGTSLLTSLIALEVSNKGYENRVARWVQDELVTSLPVPQNLTHPAERAVLSAIAGVPLEDNGGGRTIEWEGRTYQVDPAQAELQRLLRARERQGGESLDEALTSALASSSRDKAQKRQVHTLGDTLASIVYAMSLGDPEGNALAAGNVALRHDLADSTPKRRVYAAWQIASEEFGPGGWRLNGSLLALEVPLARLALRRLDNGTMPPGPRLTSSERHTAALTVMMMNPNTVSDAGRDEIAAAIQRGRARVAALTADRDEIDRVAREAGLNEWRREALAWTISHQRELVESNFSLLELFWLGGPRNTSAIALDAWGVASQRTTGCLCLEMPRPTDADHLIGRPVSGMLGARGPEVALRVAEALAEDNMPASLAPGVLAFAMQDVLDAARLAYQDDWTEFSRAARELDKDQIADYISALAAGGPLIPPRVNSDKRP
jgi:hypothetical protein